MGGQDQSACDGRTSPRSFRDLFRAYAERSSIKCLPRLIHAKSPLHKVLWFITFIIGGSVASFLLSGLIQTYVSYETTLSVTAEEGGRPPFPDVTVCNLNPLWNNAEDWGFRAYVEGNDKPLTYDEYIYMLFDNLERLGKTNTSVDVTMPELYSVSGFWKHARYDDRSLDEMSSMFVWKCLWEKDNQPRNCVVRPAFTATNGLCYTIRPPPGEGVAVRPRQEGLAVILYLNNINIRFVADYRLSPFQSYTEGVKVLLHPRDTVPQMVEGFTVSPGSQASVVVKYHERKLLQSPYSSCQDGLDLNFTHIRNADDVWKYSEYACRSLCYQNKIIEMCGCLDSTELVFEDLIKRYRFCSKFNLNDPRRALQEMNCTRSAKAYQDERNACTLRCPTPCTKDVFQNTINQVSWPQEVYILGFYYTYVRPRPPSDEFSRFYDTAIGYAMMMNTSEAVSTVRSTDLIQRNFLQLAITMDDTIIIDEDKPAMKIETIFGSLGGILNLWIGFTFITIMEFVDLFLTIVMERISSSKVAAANKKAQCKNKERKPQVTMVEPFRL